MQRPSPTSDSRRDQRISRELSWAASSVLGAHGSDQSFGALLDVSQNGLRIRTPQPPPRGSKVWLRINAGEDIVECVAIARWVQEIEPGLYEFGAEIGDDEAGKDLFFDALTRDDDEVQPPS